MIDMEAKLLLPSQILNHHPEPVKVDKSHASSETNQVWSLLLLVWIFLKTSIDQEKYLEPSSSVRDLDIFAQCYYRWMPILEIRNGGFVQIDLYNRMILSNIHKLQRSLETGNVNDLQLDLKKDDDSTVSRPETTSNGKHTRVPVVNSFFPFSITDGDDNNSNLNDILIFSSDVLTEGSVFELD